MAWMMDTYSMNHGTLSPAWSPAKLFTWAVRWAVKSHRPRRIRHRSQVARRGYRNRGRKVALQGFGNVGSETLPLVRRRRRADCGDSGPPPPI